MCEIKEKCCRLCLDTESDHVAIFGDSIIHLQIKSCLAMTISANDNLPKNICSCCASQLSDFYNFQLNARCSQDWLESSIKEQSNKSTETKLLIQPLPDSEYNSDSLLEFLNNTANIEEYLNNLGKEDIPCIVNMLDRNQENSLDGVNKVQSNIKSTKLSPKKKDDVKTKICSKMEIDVLDSDIEIVQELLKKETEPKKVTPKEKNPFQCFGCKSKLDNLQKLSQHLGTCEMALRTCIQCHLLFDSKQKMQQHSITHNVQPLTCMCGKTFLTRDKLIQHVKSCSADFTTKIGCLYRCKQCKETFKERFQLYKHVKQHIVNEDKRICDICGHSFVDNDALMKHKTELHKKLAKNMYYRCKVCQYKSTDRKVIYQHIQKNCLPTKQKDVLHLCESCGKSFTTKATLLRHMSQHSTEHKCNVCQKTFADAKLKEKHVVQHVEVTMCEKCGQSVCCYNLDAHSCV